MNLLLLQLLLIPLIGSLGLAISAGFVGCFIVWRRMAYFGDTLAHASLLGFALGSLLHLPTNLSVIAVCVGTGLTLARTQQQRKLADDTLLGIISHGTLALGLIILASNPIPGRSLHSLLVGDLLTLAISDLYWIWGYSGITLILGILNWRALTSWVIDEELAQIEGHPVQRLRYGLMVFIALFIALTMQFVGVLLITALLISPAASARLISQSPEQMARRSIVLAVTACIVGVLAAGWVNLPVGPCIVVAAALCFCGCFVWSQMLSKA